MIEIRDNECILEFFEKFQEKNTTIGLVHCVSRDFAMGAGLALSVNNRFGSRDFCKKEEALNATGIRPMVYCQLLHKEDETKQLFHLVTKSRFWNKPTADSFENALGELVARVDLPNVLVFPKLGCGLDRLDWTNTVEPLVKQYFKSKPEIHLILFPTKPKNCCQ